MRLRPAVLLTLSESIHPPRLLSYRHIAPVSPLFSTLTKSAQPLHSRRLSFLLFSYTYELFWPLQNLNPFLFMRFRTLCQKHPGWGWGASSHSAEPCSFPCRPTSLPTCFYPDRLGEPRPGATHV